MTSKRPVIYGVPPDPSSRYTHGRRFFENTTIDRKGHPRRVSSGDDSDDSSGIGDVDAKTDNEETGDEDDVDSNHANDDTAEVRASSPPGVRQLRSKGNPSPTRNGGGGVAELARAAGINTRTVRLEIPDTPVQRQSKIVPEDAQSLSSGTGSDWLPSPEPSPAARPSTSRRELKRKASDILPSDSDAADESLDEMLLATATSKRRKGKERHRGVGRWAQHVAGASDTSETLDDPASATSQVCLLHLVREMWC